MTKRKRVEADELLDRLEELGAKQHPRPLANELLWGNYNVVSYSLPSPSHFLLSGGTCIKLATPDMLHRMSRDFIGCTSLCAACLQVYTSTSRSQEKRSRELMCKFTVHLIMYFMFVSLCVLVQQSSSESSLPPLRYRSHVDSGLALCACVCFCSKWRSLQEPPWALVVPDHWPVPKRPQA